MRWRVLTAMMVAFACVASMTALPAEAQIRPREMADVSSGTGDMKEPPPPGPAHFEPIGRDIMIPAGESVRFEVRSGGFAHAAVLAAGRGGSDEGMVGLVTLFGPPLVPSGPPVPLGIGPEGRVAGHALTPVLGPLMVIIVNNGTSSDITLDLSAYLTR